MIAPAIKPQTVTAQTLNNELQYLTFARGVRLLISGLILLPGVVFGLLFLAMTPVNLFQGRGSLFLILPVCYSVLQFATLGVWLRASQKHGLRKFVSWTAATVICSVALIADLQRQINTFDGFCGNVMLGAQTIQWVACGTVAGMLLLAFDLWRHFHELESV